MGLDQYLYAVKEPMPLDETKRAKWWDENISMVNDTQVYYWRKHANLNGYMESLFKEKGSNGDFNCECMELTASDLEKIIRRLVNRESFPYATGFFWGTSEDSEEEMLQDLKAFTHAYVEMKAGKFIYYSANW
jgi:hypothetical protein